VDICKVTAINECLQWKLNLFLVMLVILQGGHTVDKVGRSLFSMRQKIHNALIRYCKSSIYSSNYIVHIFGEKNYIVHLCFVILMVKSNLSNLSCKLYGDVSTNAFSFG
jgi:hypothetical protein